MQLKSCARKRTKNAMRDSFNLFNQPLQRDEIYSNFCIHSDSDFFQRELKKIRWFDNFVLSLIIFKC